jgi:hypothetical protein
MIFNDAASVPQKPKQGKAKAYQVKQVRDVILKYQLGGQSED